MKNGITYLLLAFSLTSWAQEEIVPVVKESEIKPYAETSNAGLNRIERIEHIESYLKSLSKTLSTMESKVNENSDMLKKLDSSITSLRAKEIKEMIENLNKEIATAQGEARPLTYQEEINAIKADILKLKNSDIQNINTEMQGLNGMIRNLETILKTR